MKTPHVCQNVEGACVANVTILCTISRENPHACLIHGQIRSRLRSILYATKSLAAARKYVDQTLAYTSSS